MHCATGWNDSYLYCNTGLNLHDRANCIKSCVLRRTCRVHTGEMFQVKNSSRVKSDWAELDRPFGWRRWWKVNHCRGPWLPADTGPMASLPDIRFLPYAHGYIQCQGPYGSWPKCRATPSYFSFTARLSLLLSGWSGSLLLWGWNVNLNKKNTVWI